MISLEEFVKEIKSHIDTAPTIIEGCFYPSILFKVPKINLQGLIPRFRKKKIFFFATPDREEFLACLPIKSFTFDSEIYSFIEQYPKEDLFGSFRFDKHAPHGDEWGTSLRESFFFIPSITFHSRPDQSYLNLTIKAPLDSSVIPEIMNLLDSIISPIPPSSPKKSVYKKQDKPLFAIWNRQISKGKDLIKKNILTKIVLARKKIISYDRSFDPYDFFQKTCAHSPLSYKIFFSYDLDHLFLSVSPECLFKMNEQVIKIDCIAGTSIRSIDPRQDKELASILLKSPKELQEHRIVATEIEKFFTNNCKHYEAIKKEHILKLNYLQHIYSTYKGYLKRGKKLEHLLTELHPTPALGGFPKDIAMQFIRNTSSFDRGLYGAPIGVLSAKNTHLAVGIRSCLVNFNDRSLHLLSGSGIVKDSCSDLEWQETQLKMQNFQASLP